MCGTIRFASASFRGAPRNIGRVLHAWCKPRSPSFHDTSQPENQGAGGRAPERLGLSLVMQARWAAANAVALLRVHRAQYERLCVALRQRRSVGECVIAIEQGFDTGADAATG